MTIDNSVKYGEGSLGCGYSDGNGRCSAQKGKPSCYVVGDEDSCRIRIRNKRALEIIAERVADDISLIASS